VRFRIAMIVLSIATWAVGFALGMVWLSSHADSKDTNLIWRIMAINEYVLGLSFVLFFASFYTGMKSLNVNLSLQYGVLKEGKNDHKETDSLLANGV